MFSTECNILKVDETIIFPMEHISQFYDTPFFLIIPQKVPNFFFKMTLDS